MAAPVDRLSRTQLLARFRSKAGCAYTQPAAESLWRRLDRHLTCLQRTQLQVAWSHCEIGEGRAELDAVCADVVRSWGAP